MSNNQVPSSDILDALMKDPMKKALLLQLLHQEKDGFEAYKRREEKQATPLKNVKRLHCESPTALQRRKALEKLNQDVTSEGSSSELSEVSTEISGPKLPFEKLLAGVRAYVEVKRNNVDKSEGIKAVMQLMGATIKNELTRDITHVVFKDGSFTTYQRAKLMNIHLVSVLWLDAIRRHNARVPEKNYPAFGSQLCEDENVSILCSQIQKDYEDIVKDEKRRTISHKPIAKTRDKNRRHTLMTSQASFSSYLTAKKSMQEALLSDEEPEIDTISTERRSKSPELTSDDSECGVIDGQVTKRTEPVLTFSPSITDDLSNASKEADKSSSLLDSSDSRSLFSRVTAKNKKKTVNVVSNVVVLPESEKIRSDKPEKVLQSSNVQSTMSSLRMSSGSDRTKSGLDKDIEGSKLSRLSKGKENCSIVETTMSSLRLSDSLEKCAEVLKTIDNDEDIKQEQESEKQVKINKNKSSKSFTALSSTRTSRRSSVCSSSKDSKNKTARGNVPSDSSLINEEVVQDSTTKIDSGSSIQSKKNKQKRETHARSRRSLFKPDIPEDTDSMVISKTTKRVNNRRSVFVQMKRNGKTKEGTDLGDDEWFAKDCGNVDRLHKATASNSRRSISVENGDTSEEKKSKQNDEIRKNRSLSRTRSISNQNISSPAISASTKSENSEFTEDSSSPAKKTRLEDSTVKKTRKLYNPEDMTALSPLEDDKEREEYVKNKLKKSPNDVFVNPNDLHISQVRSKTKAKASTNLQQSEIQIGIRKKTISQTGAGDSDCFDNNQSLLKLLSKEMDKEPMRPSRRISLSQSQRKNQIISSFSDSESVASLPITPLKRRSTLDFQPATIPKQRKKKSKPVSRKLVSIVGTKMHRHESENLAKIVKRLGTFFLENQVTDRTTHLVAGEHKRTINMLRAIARGCWILKHEWLLKSNAEGRWLPEEDYEVIEFSPAVQQCRLQRQAFGPKFRMDVFKNCGLIYVAKVTRPKQADLKELIETCQGKLTAIYRNAAIAVGEVVRGEGICCVTELWVLDSITRNKMQPLKNYLLKNEIIVGSPCF